MSTNQRGLWICIDGVEGAGKTTIAQGLTTALGAIGVSEFSGTPIGSALRAAVKISPHFISKSPLAQSLVFIGDFIELVHSKVCPALNDGKIVITDRGYLSKYAYQEVVLESAMSRTEARILLDGIFTFLPVPDATLLLTAPRDVLQNRLIARGENCGESRLGFLDKAAVAAREFLERRPTMNAAVIDSDRTIEETFQELRQALVPLFASSPR